MVGAAVPALTSFSASRLSPRTKPLPLAAAEQECGLPLDRTTRDYPPFRFKTKLAGHSNLSPLCCLISALSDSTEFLSLSGYLPRVPWSPTVSLASRNASFHCGLLYLSVFSRCSFPSISPPVSPLWYGMVGTVAGDGAPRSLSVVRSSGVCWTRPFIVLWQFPCWAPSLLAAVVSPCPRFLRDFCGSYFVVSCGTGWASTSIDNLWPLFHLRILPGNSS